MSRAAGKALGMRLMNRTTRMLQRTEEGVAFLRQARIAVKALDAAVGTVETQRPDPSGRVRVTTSTAFGCAHLLPLLPELLARYPALSVGSTSAIAWSTSCAKAMASR